MRHRQSSVCFLRLEDQSIQPIHHGLIPLEEDRAGAQQDDGKTEDAHCGNVDPRGGGDVQQPCDQDVGVRGEECGTGVYKDGFRLFHYLFAYNSIPCFHNIFKSAETYRSCLYRRRIFS